MAEAIAAPPEEVAQRYRTRSSASRLGHAVFLCAASMLFLAYMLAPVAWLVTSSFQNEREIISKPPHWIPHEPTMQNFVAIFAAKDKTVTYETRRAADPASGGYIPSTAKQPSAGDRQQPHRRQRRGHAQSCWSAFRRPTRWPRSASAAARHRSTASSPRASFPTSRWWCRSSCSSAISACSTACGR